MQQGKGEAKLFESKDDNFERLSTVEAFCHFHTLQ
jgi:hypothetical protein